MPIVDDIYQIPAKLELKQKLKKRYGTSNLNLIIDKFEEFAEKYRSFHTEKYLYPSIIVMIGCGGAGMFTLTTLLRTFFVSAPSFIAIDPDIITVDNAPRLVFPPIDQRLDLTWSLTTKAYVAGLIYLDHVIYYGGKTGLTLPMKLNEEELFMLLDKVNVDNALIIEAASYETLRQVSKYVIERGRENIKAKIISVGYSTEEQKFHIFDVVKEPEVNHKPVINDYSGAIDLEKWWEGFKDIVDYFLNEVDLPKEKQTSINIPNRFIDIASSADVAVDIDSYTFYIVPQQVIEDRMKLAEEEAKELLEYFLTEF